MPSFKQQFAVEKRLRESRKSNLVSHLRYVDPCDSDRAHPVEISGPHPYHMRERREVKRAQHWQKEILGARRPNCCRISPRNPQGKALMSKYQTYQIAFLTVLYKIRESRSRQTTRSASMRMEISPRVPNWCQRCTMSTATQMAFSISSTEQKTPSDKRARMELYIFERCKCNKKKKNLLGGSRMSFCEACVYLFRFSV